MPPDRRLPDALASYPDDRDLLRALLAAPAELGGWPAGGLDALGFTRGQRALAVTWALDAEVRNAGFGRWFEALGPEVGAASAEALAGLEALGAAEHRALLAAALERLRERGLPRPPDGAAWRSSPDPARPATEPEYEAQVRGLVGAAPPALELHRARAAARRAHDARLAATFEPQDRGWRALARGGGLEVLWAAYVRAHAAEFFSR